MVDLTSGEKIPAEILAALSDETVTKWAFNAMFERVCLSNYLGEPLEPEDWRERYRQAVEYMAWFLPAWEELSEDERYVLETFYGDGNEYGSSVIYQIADHFRIEQSSAYNKKNRALYHLTTLLFGKG